MPVILPFYTWIPPAGLIKLRIKAKKRLVQNQPPLLKMYP